jgi:cytidine deaminase
MKDIEIKIQAKVYDSIDELSHQDQKIMDIAIKQLDAAYAPYSKFHVGAAALTINGSIYPGCNQENASYPLCMCGERVALYNAGASEPNVPIEAVAITIKNQLKPVNGLISPCGACRQVLSEFEKRHKHPIRVLLKADGPQIYVFNNVDQLLPYGFDGEVL